NDPVALVPRRAVTHAERLFRVSAVDPAHDVEVVDVLLDDVVAAQPGVAVPVVDLESDVAHAGLAVALPQDALVPVAAPGDDIADLAVVQPLDRLDIGELVAALRAGRDAQLLLQRVLVGFEHLADAGAVHADGLFGKDVLARRHRRLQVVGPE